MCNDKKNKPTKTEFVKQVHESKSCGEIRVNTSAYDLNENGGFQKSRNQSYGSNFPRSMKM